MKQAAVLSRPNLKLFLLGALMIALIEHFVIDVRSEGPMLVNARTADQATRDALLASLLEQVHQNPTSELCTQISSIYEGQGDYKKAIVFLRQAEILAEIEE